MRSSQRASPMNRRPSPCHSRSAAWSGQSPTGCSGSTWCRRQKVCRRSRKSPCPKSCHKGPNAPSSVACPPAKTCSLLKPLCTPRPRHAGQAPTVLLKENSAGSKGGKGAPQAEHAGRTAKTRSLPASGVESTTWPSPASKAACSDPCRRRAMPFLTTRRSTTTDRCWA